MISNDTAYVPALVVANPGWHGQYDQDAPRPKRRAASCSTA